MFSNENDKEKMMNLHYLSTFISEDNIDEHSRPHNWREISSKKRGNNCNLQ